jgi:hypothetical protein
MRQREVTFHVCATSRQVGGWLEHLADLCCELQAIGAQRGGKTKHIHLPTAGPGVMLMLVTPISSVSWQMQILYTGKHEFPDSVQETRLI